MRSLFACLLAGSGLLSTCAASPHFTIFGDDSEMPPKNWTRPPSKALNATIRESVLRKFAPVVYFHPEEAYLPADPAKTFAKHYDAAADELRVPVDRLGGAPLRDGRFVDVPVTTQARVIPDGRIALQYWYYHYYNGPQGFKTVDSKGRVTRWPWYPLAVHYADWEHTTIVLRGEDDLSIESVFYTVHADINEPQRDFLVEDGTHPLVYSHNNSHACYKTPADVQNTDPAFDGFINSAVRAITFGAITRIEVGDIGFANFPESEWIRWSDYDMYDITEAIDGNGPDWALWQGHWGPAFDQSMVSIPPEGVPWRRFFFDFLQMLYLAGRLTKFVVEAKPAPRGPLVHYTYQTLDIFPPPDKFIPEDPNGHKPGFLSIVAFVYFILGFVGIILCLVSLVLIGLYVVVRAAATRGMEAWTRSRARRLEMTERTPLLS